MVNMFPKPLELLIQRLGSPNCVVAGIAWYILPVKEISWLPSAGRVHFWLRTLYVKT